MPNLFRYAVGSVERGLVAHPVLLAMLPALFLWSHNIGDLSTDSLSDIVLPIAVPGSAALVLTVGALALNAKWIFGRLKDFKPYERPATPVVPTASVTAAPSATYEGPTPPKLD